jgi:hypothetical protein
MMRARLVARADWRAPKARGGFATLEVALALPVFAVIFMGMIEFTLLFYARGMLVDASRAGARAATRLGASRQAIRAEVLQVLPPALHEDLEIWVSEAARSGQPVTVAARIPMKNAAPDLLWLVGYGLTGRMLHAEATMIKE